MRNRANLRESSELLMRFGPTAVVALLCAVFLLVEPLRWGLVVTVPLLLLAMSLNALAILAVNEPSN